MLTQWLGLNNTYNLLHSSTCQDEDIVRLREPHAEMDNTILACYSWQDIDLHHDFYQNERGQTRFMPSAKARRELLMRLMELNKELANSE